MAAVISTTCKLCYEEYSNKRVERIPRRLQCDHIFCTECLLKLNQSQEDQSSIECPLCLEVTIPPVKGIDYLPTEYALLKTKSPSSKIYTKCKFCIKKTYPPKSATLHCVDCQTFYCGSCSDDVHLKVKNQDHVLRLANSIEDVQLSRIASVQANGKTSKIGNCPDEKPSIKRINSGSSICSEHHQYLSMYCQQDKVRCCVQCRLSSKHQIHDCEMVQTNDDQERNTLIDWQIHLENEIERHNKVRLSVQKTIELLKKNTVATNEGIRKVFWELRSLINDLEKDLTQEVTNFSNNKLNKLRHQCSSMIEKGSAAKNCSRMCEEALDLDFFEMLVQKKKLESNVVEALQSLQENQESCENADLFVQFPKYETLLNSLRNCPYIVRAPPSPCDFECTLTEDSKVSLRWSAPKHTKYIYPVNLYNVYGSVGDDESFVSIQKTSQTFCLLPSSHPMLCDKQMVQFQVTSINVTGESKPCFPLCIRLVKSRDK